MMILLESMDGAIKATMEAVFSTRDELTRKIEEQGKRHEARFDSLEAAVRVNSQDIRVLQQDVHGLKEDVHVLKEDVRGLKEDVHVLKEDVHVLKEDVRVLKEDVHVLKEDVRGLKGETQRLGEAVLGLTIAVEKKADQSALAATEKRVDVIEHRLGLP